MGILDTFYILFDTDAKKAEREMEELRKKGEGVAHAIDDSVKHAKQLPPALGEAEANAGRLGKSFGTVVGLATALAATVGAGLAVAIRARIEDVDKLSRTAARLRIDVSQYDAWLKLVKAAGGEVGTAQTSLEGYADTLDKINAGVNKRGQDTFRGLGLSAADANGDVKDARIGLLELAGALEGLTRQQQLAKIRRLQITDETTIKLLLQGRAAIEAQSAAQVRNGVVTKEAAERVRAYKESASEVQDVLMGWVDAIMTAVLPALTAGNKAMAWAGKWLNDNKRFVEGLGVAMVIGAGIALAVYAPALWSAAAATLAATWPVLLLIAAIVALGVAFALAYDDVKAFLNGQKSLIGDLLDRYPLLGKVVLSLMRAFRAVSDFIKEWGPQVLDVIGTVIGGIWSFVQGVYSFIAPILGLLFSLFKAVFLGGIWPVVKFVFDVLLQIATNTFKIVGQLVWVLGRIFFAVFGYIAEKWQNLFGRIINGLNQVINGARRMLGLGVSDNAERAAGGVGRGQRQLGLAAGSPFASLNGAAISNTNRRGGDRNVHIGSMSVNTQATDADGVAAAINNSLQGHLSAAGSEFDDGVDR